MNAQLVDIESIIPYASNPRNNAHAVDKVAASIKQFGIRQPIVVDKDMVIIAGHTRYLAAKKLGLKQFPVHVAEDLSPAQVKAYRIADNRVAQEATWDNELLKYEFEGLHDFEFDLLETGFTQKEINKILGFELVEPELVESKTKFTVTVECEDESDQEAVCKLLTSKGYKCRAI